MVIPPPSERPELLLIELVVQHCRHMVTTRGALQAVWSVLGARGARELLELATTHR